MFEEKRNKVKLEIHFDLLDENIYDLFNIYPVVGFTEEIMKGCGC